jgi:hypothetical protein
MTLSPSFLQVHSVLSVAQDLGGFWEQPENVAITAIIGGAVGIYGISKLDVIKSLFSYFLILLGLCMVILIVPSFSGTGTEQYADQMLLMMNELLRSLIQYVQRQIQQTAPALIEGMIQ